LINIDSHRLIMTTAIAAVCLVAWLIYTIETNSRVLIVAAEAVTNVINRKRQATAEMNSAARERSLIVLRMFHEQDIFIKDEMSMQIRNEASRMSKAIAKFRAAQQTNKQKDLFSAVVSQMQSTAPKVLEVSDLLIEEKNGHARVLLFNFVLPNQDAILNLLHLLDNLVDEEGKKNSQSLQQALSANRELIISLVALFVFFTGCIFFLVQKGYARREREIQLQGEKLQESNAINQSILDTAPDAILSINQKGIIRRVNNAALKLSGFKSDALLDSNIIILSLSKKEIILTTAQILQCQQPEEITLLDSQGNKIPILLTVSNTGIEGDLEFTCVFHDLREIKVAQAEITIQKEVMDKHSLVSISDIKGNITYANDRFCNVSGYSRDELIGANHKRLNSHYHPKDFWREMYLTTAKGNPWHGEVQNKAKDGHTYWVNTTIVPLFDEDSKHCGYSSIRTDITKLKALEAELRHQASHDVLTKLANRAQFEERLERYIVKSKTSNLVGAILFIDLDRFKPVNDTAGHMAGDLLLRQISVVLSSHIRARDTVSRFGGDEFAVLLEECPPKKAEKIAETMRQEVDDFVFVHGGVSFNVSLSIGVAGINALTDDLKTAINTADNACQIAKNEGRNRVHVSPMDKSELKEHVETIAWLPKINKALASNSFELHAQKIMKIGDQSTSIHCEILIRLLNEDGTIVPPNVFIPPAERYDMMQKIDYWVLKKAFSVLKQGFSYSINLSGNTVTDDNLAGYIEALHEMYEVDPKTITFEITETAAIQNFDKTKELIRRLKCRGFRFSLDDFGSGLSSFAYLKNLPVDYLKIDGIFVKDIAIDKISYAMVKSINDVGHSMGLETIAEFVEDENILKKLEEIGVDYAQGYHIHKPQLLERIGEMADIVPIAVLN